MDQDWHFICMKLDIYEMFSWYYKLNLVVIFCLYKHNQGNQHTAKQTAKQNPYQCIIDIQYHVGLYSMKYSTI